MFCTKQPCKNCINKLRIFVVYNIQVDSTRHVLYNFVIHIQKTIRYIQFRYSVYLLCICTLGFSYILLYKRLYKNVYLVRGSWVYAISNKFSHFRVISNRFFLYQIKISLVLPYFPWNTKKINLMKKVNFFVFVADLIIIFYHFII